jgi:hypothetical protein
VVGVQVAQLVMCETQVSAFSPLPPADVSPRTSCISEMPEKLAGGMFLMPRPLASRTTKVTAGLAALVTPRTVTDISVTASSAVVRVE